MAEETRSDRMPLSPMQQAMLYQSMQAPAKGVNIEQLLVQVEPTLDMAKLVESAQELARLYPAFRGAVRWSPSPALFVQEEVAVPFVQLRLDEDAESRERFLEKDRSQGFDLSIAPLMRFTLLAYGEKRELVWTFHHALLDGRSFAPLLAKLFSPGIDELPSKQTVSIEADPFSRFLQWQRRQNFGEHQGFWRKTFEGLEKPTPLRDWRANTATGHAACGVCWPDLGKQCAARAEQWGVTAHTVVQGAWALLLSHYSQSEEVVFGSVRAGRNTAPLDLENAVGLFINTVPLRIAVPVEGQLGPWLREVRARHLALRPHEQTPLNLIAQGTGDAGQFQTLLAFENRDLDATLRDMDPAWQGRSTELHENTGLPLTLNVTATDDLRVQLSFERSSFSEEFATEVVGHLHTLLCGILAAGETTTLREIWMVSAPDREALQQWAKTLPVRCKHDSLTRWFEAAVRKDPAAKAVTCGSETHTYAELNGRANRVARMLRYNGVGTGSFVAICLPRSPETLIAMLGVLKTGAAYVPLEPDLPAERLAFIIQDSKAAFLLTANVIASSRDLPGIRVCNMDELMPDPAPGDWEDLSDSPASEDAAYVIYTSGSTGTPKGVVVEHRQVLRLMEGTSQWFHFGPDDVWTFFHSFAFDFSVWEIWGALLYGGRLVVVPYSISRAPDAFHSLLLAEGVTVLNQTPSAFRQLMTVDEARPNAHLALRYVIFGGEALDPRQLKGWFTRHGDCPRLVNMYGITETTVHVTYRPLSASDAEQGRSLIGQALPDLSTQVLDRFHQPVPLGQTGELFVGGAGLARGYLGLSELTAQRFLRDPLSTDPAARIYKTGDLARRLPDGELEYLGRGDGQVKIRGHRIEPGEIEAVLRQHPEVRDTIVLPQVVAGAARLVAFVESRGGRILEDELRAFARKTLPGYMVPALFHEVESWPLTVNGKLDREQLFATAGSGGESVKTLRKLDGLENQIAAAWCDALGVAQVDPDRNFFDCGGDSLRLLQVWSSLKSKVAPELSVVALFAHPTIGELARHLSPAIARKTPTIPGGSQRQHAWQRNQRALRQRTLL